MTVLKNHNLGFTLLEIMVALAVFAILAAITAQTIHRTIDTQERVAKQAERLDEVQLALAMIQQDTQSAMLPNNTNHVLQFFGDSKKLSFLRSGVLNTNNSAGNYSLKRVEYECQNDSLIRRMKPATDDIKTAIEERVILHHLNQCELAYLNTEHLIISMWSSEHVTRDTLNSRLPIAIRYTLRLKDWGDMSLLFIIPESLYGR